MSRSEAMLRLKAAVLALPLLLAACTPEPSLTIVADMPAPSPATFEYKQTPQTNLTMDVVYPPGWQSSDKRAAILLFFSGAWYWGTKDQLRGHADYLSQLGIVAITVDYRAGHRHGKITPADGVEDARSAMRWVRGHAKELGIDLKRIVVAGGSAGGHLAACTLLCEGINAPGDDMSISPKPQAMILLSPVLDFDRTIWESRFGGDEELELKVSPTKLMNEKIVPTLLMVASLDKQLVWQGVQFLRKSKRYGSHVWLLEFYRQEHDFFKMRKTNSKTIVYMANFLAELGYLDDRWNDVYAPSLRCHDPKCEKDNPH
jgi:acetyl esterase